MASAESVTNTTTTNRKLSINSNSSILSSVQLDLKKRRNRSGPKSKSSPFIGVSQYKRTGRWEAHIWDAEVPACGGGKGGNCSGGGAGGGGKGKQIHLGSFLTALQAARYACGARSSCHSARAGVVVCAMMGCMYLFQMLFGLSVSC